MAQQSIPLPLLGVMAGFRRFSVAEYHRLTELGILTEDDNLELLEGYLVLKMARNPPHDGTLHRASIACYWIVNIPDQQLEVYTAPSGPTASPTYARRQDYRAGDLVPFMLAGNTIASLPIQDLLP
jgi:hypothetical protein